MSSSQQGFVAEHYTARARDYVDSLNHRTGDDLDQLEAELRGCEAARVLDLGCGGARQRGCSTWAAAEAM